MDTAPCENNCYHDCAMACSVVLLKYNSTKIPLSTPYSQCGVLK